MDSDNFATPPQPIGKPCPGCGCALSPGLTLCVPCKVSQRAKQDAAQQSKDNAARAKGTALADTLAAFPEVIRETDPEQLDGRLKAIVQAYDPTRRESWLLFGATRVGKTRTAFCLARRFAEVMGKPATFLTMRKFETLVDKSFQTKRHGEMLEGLIAAPFLVLDDFGKERLTERLAVDLFALVDERTADRRPTIITTNLTGDVLEAKFAAVEPNLAAALVARLREFFQKQSAF